ncbi:MAG: immunoglobulin-like domain-containing protein, partial [Candidatus Ornithomonoglobus sp.]
SIDLGNTSSVIADITIPSDGNITWETSDASVITADGKVTRTDETKTAVLIAKTTANGIEFTREFTITVKGSTSVLSTFAAYAENSMIYYTSDYDSTTPYSISVMLASAGNDIITLDQQDGQASGSFGQLANGTYKITCSLRNNTSIVKSVTKTIKVADEPQYGAYLFAHFVGTESSADCEQIYFSVSDDGTTWKTINGGSPMLTSTVGELGVRDPYILRGEDGKFFVIATDLSIYNRRDDSNRWGTCQTAGSKSIVIWESDDLVNWSAANLVKVAVDNAGCTWAPEAVYDAEKDSYMVFWASKVSDDGYTVQRIYRSYTTDFKTFTEPELYIDGGNVSNIDTTIVSDKGVYYRFTKNESKSSVTMMKATSLDGPWTDVSTYTINDTAGNTVTGYEGPAIYKLNGTDSWCLLLDYYSKSQGYKPFTTTDISKGVFTSAADFSFDATYRHGTVMTITTEEYNKLIEAYPLAD